MNEAVLRKLTASSFHLNQAESQGRCSVHCINVDCRAVSAMRTPDATVTLYVLVLTGNTVN